VRVGSCWPWRLLCTWVCIVLLTAAPLSFGSELSETVNSIERRLLTISAYSKKLEAELESWAQNRSGRLQQRVSALLALQGQLKTRLAELSKTYSASEDSWRRALQAAEARERVRRIQGTIWAVVAALAGAGIGYGLARLAGP
jgi:hypothetical protein